MPNRDEVARFTTTKTVEDDETASLLAFQFCDFDQQLKKNTHCNEKTVIFYIFLEYYWTSFLANIDLKN